MGGRSASQGPPRLVLVFGVVYTELPNPDFGNSRFCFSTYNWLTGKLVLGNSQVFTPGYKHEFLIG